MNREKRHYTTKGAPVYNKQVKAHVGDVIEILHTENNKRLQKHGIKKYMMGKVIAITNSKKGGYSDWFYKINFPGVATDWLMSGSHWEVLATSMEKEMRYL